MKNIILFFTAFIHSKDLFIYVNGIYFRAAPTSYFLIKNKQGFKIWYKTKNKLIYESWEPRKIWSKL